MSSEEHPKDRDKSSEKRPAPISQPPPSPADSEEGKAPISFGQTPQPPAAPYFPQPGAAPPPSFGAGHYPPPPTPGQPPTMPSAGPYPPQPPQGNYPSYPPPAGQYPPTHAYPPPGGYPPGGYPPGGQFGAAPPNQTPPPYDSAAPPASSTPPPAAEPPAAADNQPPPSAKRPAKKSPRPAAPPKKSAPPKKNVESEKPSPPRWRGEEDLPTSPSKPTPKKQSTSPKVARPKRAPSQASAASPPRRADSDKGPMLQVATDRKGLPQQAPKRMTPQVVEPELQVTEHAPPEEDLTAKSTKLMPPWMVSMLVHFALVVLLALIAFSPRPNQDVVVTATYAEQLGEQLEQPFVLDEADLMEDDVTGFDITLFESEQPPPESLTTLAANGTKAKQKEIETPGVDYNFRSDGGGKKALLKAYGGNATTEQAVKAALDWLKRNQRRDGSWSLKGPYSDGAGLENSIAATAMALLAFQGAGHTTLEGVYVKEVTRGWNYLLSQMDNDGTFISGPLSNQHRLYTQAQATIALCELYGMTRDEQYRQPAQRAIDYAVRIQSPEGGWRYTPGEGADTSVTGWFVMAMASAKLCGLNVPNETLDRIGGFLDSVAKENGSRYAYQPSRNQPPTLSMTAEGLLCRQYLGWTQEDPRLIDGVDYLVSNPITWKEPDVYYWYYATQVAHHTEGQAWQAWNKVMRQAIPEQQVKDGREKGSWSPEGDKHGVIGGRLFMTCLCVYMLEVYYRHLPIYSKSEVLSLQ
ncbi:MAG: prenyltransferase/squalene oxidase repeat-containing protein [Blastopirellula sp. JB062]